MIRHRAVFDGVRDAIFLADIDTGMIVDANPAAESLCGRSITELRSLHHTQLHPQEAMGSAGLGFAKEAQVPGLSQATVLHKDGRRIPVEISSSHFTTPEGKRLVVGVFRDNAERDRARENLRQSEERFRQVAESAGEFIWEVDVTGLYTYASPVVEQILGYTPEEIVGRMHFYDFFVPETREEIKKAAFDAFGRQEPFRAFLNWNVRKDGRLVALETSGLPIVGANGELLGYRGADTDVTERWQAEERLRANEARLREAQRLAKVGSWEFDVGAGTIHCSDEVFRICGLPNNSQPDSSTFLCHVHPKDREIVLEAREKALSSIAPVDAEFRIIRPDGDVRFVRSIVEAIKDDRGAPVHFIGAIQDVTEQVKARELLRESEERLKSAERMTHVGNWSWDPKGDHVSWSAEIRRIFGKPPEYTPSFHGFLEAIVPQDRERVHQAIRSCLAEKRGYSVEFQISRPNGDLRTITCSAEVLLDEEALPVRVFGACQDVTDMRRAQEEAFAGQKLESVGTLASGIAHDFNNLLGGVLAQAELALAEFAAGSSPVDALHEIREVALRGSEIVRQLMIHAGKEITVTGLVDVSRIVREMTQLLKVSISKHATLDADLGENLPAVRGSAAQLRQIVLNLVVNASEAMGDRDGVIRVTTRCVTANRGAAISKGLAEGDYLQLGVSDTGHGMPPETQARVFDPFFTTKAAGRGLGLAVVHGIVRNLRGAIHVASEPGKGTTFQIWLPCAEATSEAPADPIARVDEASGPSQAATILVVEDEDSLRQPVATVLRKRGFEVFEAANGSTAIDLLRANGSQIDAILLDMNIPGASTHEVLAQAAQTRPELKVILTSAYSEETVRATTSSPLIRCFVRKPFQIRDLLQTIRNVLSS